jgi:uridine kinase
VRGDKLIIRDEHRKAANRIVEILIPEIEAHDGVFGITVAGESGAGKSEIAQVIRENLERRGFRSIILQQDDYFVYPPHTNAVMRRRDIGHVGPSEVRLGLLDGNLGDIKGGASEIEKPLVIFDEDRITTETISVTDVDVLVVEGTYTTLLENADRRVFIEQTRQDTRRARRERAREEQDEFLERILRIEHQIISKHRALSDLIVTRDYEVVSNEREA